MEKNKTKKGLGKGLNALFEDVKEDKTSVKTLIEKEAPSEGTVRSLRIIDVEPNPNQPRRNFDKDALEALSNSIKTHGVVSPILVQKGKKGMYTIIAGERRWRASKLAGLTEIPAIIIDADALKAAELAIIENIQREDLNPFEEAQAYRSLMTQYSLTQEEVASKVGKSRSAIANTMRLLDLPEEVLEMLQAQDISAGHARALLGLKDKDAIVDTDHKILIRSLNVRDTEDLVKKMNKLKPVVDTVDDEPLPVVDYCREMELKIQSHLGRVVKINSSGRKKSVTLFYEDNGDLDEIITLLCGKDFLDEI